VAADPERLERVRAPVCLRDAHPSHDSH
jgi:hypothetical protein